MSGVRELLVDFIGGLFEISEVLAWTVVESALIRANEDGVSYAATAPGTADQWARQAASNAKQGGTVWSLGKPITSPR